MKLYYSAGSCSASCHISLEESGLPYEAIAIDFENPDNLNEGLVAKLNQMGTVPILVTDDGKQLDQNVSIHAYIAEKTGYQKILGTPGTFAYSEGLNWLSWVASDFHKSLGAIFATKMISEDTKVQEAFRNFFAARANECFQYLESHLQGKDYLVNNTFSGADAYAFIVLSWTQWLEVPLTSFPQVQNYMKRISARPAVMKVMKDEGLV